MCRVMVVDDEPLVREAIAHIISSEFDSVYLVGSTGSGEKAVDLALKERPDIIIMDIRLDDQDGFKAIEEIKEFMPGCVMVVISANDSFSYARQALRLGVADYMLKPLNKQDIIDIIDNACLRVETEGSHTFFRWQDKERAGNLRTIPLEYSGEIPLDKERELLQYINLKNFRQAREKLNEICEKISSDFFREEIKDYCREILIVIIRQIFSSTSIEKLEFTSKFKRDEMIAALRNADTGERAQEILQEHFRQLLHYLERRDKEAADADDIMHKARQYIEENYDSQLNLEEVAGEVGLSSSYFSRSFKKKFGISFTDYLNQLRVDRARRLLQSSSKNISEIAAEVGYNDSNYFSKVFKKEEGLAPTEYRKAQS